MNICTELSSGLGRRWPCYNTNQHIIIVREEISLNLPKQQDDTVEGNGDRALCSLEIRRYQKRVWFWRSLVRGCYRVFSLTWPAFMQIYWNKRKRLHKKRVQLPEDWFGTPTWPPFYCFGTPIWPPWRHVKTLYWIKRTGRRNNASVVEGHFQTLKSLHVLLFILQVEYKRSSYYKRDKLWSYKVGMFYNVSKRFKILSTAVHWNQLYLKYSDYTI